MGIVWILGILVVGHRLTSLSVLLFHVSGELFGQQIEKISAAVECAHLYLVEFFIDVVLGYLYIEGFGEFEYHILHGELLSEALSQVEGIAYLHECDFLVDPFQSYVLNKLIVCRRFNNDILQIADGLSHEVECLADKGSKGCVDGVAVGFGLEMRYFNLDYKQCADGIAFVLVGTAHLEYLHYEVAVSDVEILLIASKKLAEEFGLGKGEYVHIGAGG